MKRKLTYEQIVSQFNISDWNSQLISNCKLDPKDKEESVKYIIDKLNSRESGIRYIASLMIIQFKINEAAEMLIKRILDTDTLGSNGTMAYALKELDCKNNLVHIFRILATQSFESKCHAYNILSEQEFEFTKDDICEMKQIFEHAFQNKKTNQIFDDETLQMIANVYEGFKQYLIE